MRKIVLGLLLITMCFPAFTQVLRYVSPEGKGKANGESPKHAADFLDVAFWKEVQSELNKQQVTVKFSAGDYVRAFTEKPLLIVNIGHPVNRLILEADPHHTIFTHPTGHRKKSNVIKVSNSFNLTLKNFKFTGDGAIDYVLNITSLPGTSTHDILIENCTWEDMRGVVFGATGATLEGTHHVTFKNCTFKRVGYDARSHMIYNAYSSHHISVIDSYFEDCPGDYIRFRDKCDFGMVKGCTFVHPEKGASVRFISMPLYNDGKPFPGNESFATNYSFTNNSFTSAVPTVDAFMFLNSGYSAVGFNYLLTAEEGTLLSKGSEEQKRSLLQTNFGISPQKVRVFNNSFKGITDDFVLRSSANYGAKSKGWTGSVKITSLINKSPVPFEWESHIEKSTLKSKK